MDAIHIDTRLNRFQSQVKIPVSNNIISSRDWLIPLRCNFWVQSAYTLLLVGVLSAVLYLNYGINFLLGTAFYTLTVSLILLMATFGGKDTLRSYRRVRSHIKSHGSFDQRLQRKYLEQMYCRRAGARAAAKDLGMSDELLPALANVWRLL